MTGKMLPWRGHLGEGKPRSLFVGLLHHCFCPLKGVTAFLPPKLPNCSRTTYSRKEVSVPAKSQTAASGTSLPCLVSKVSLELRLAELRHLPDVLHFQDVHDGSTKLAPQVTATAETRKGNETPWGRLQRAFVQQKLLLCRATRSSQKFGGQKRTLGTSLLLTIEGCVRAEMGMAPWLTQFQRLSQIHLWKMIPNYALKNTSQAPCFLSTWTGPFPPTLFHH